MTPIGVPEQDWVSSGCTLSTAERRLRMAEWDRFFGESVWSVGRSTATQLDVVFSSAEEGVARDLAQQEASCCSFFRFDFEQAGDEVLLRISVPLEQVAVLDALQAHVDSLTAALDRETS